MNIRRIRGPGEKIKLLSELTQLNDIYVYLWCDYIKGRQICQMSKYGFWYIIFLIYKFKWSFIFKFKW